MNADTRSQPGEAPLRRPVVLVVDDTPANLTLLAQVLNKDYQVKIAISGRRALEIAARWRSPGAARRTSSCSTS